jgi:fucose permease
MDKIQAITMHPVIKGEQRLKNQRIAVSILFFVNGFSFANLPTRLPELQRFYGVSNTQLGLVLVCSSVGALVAMLLSSRVMARFGSRRVATVTALTFAAVPPFLTFIPYVAVLLPLFFVIGSAIGSLEAERLFKRPIMASFHAVFSIGGGIGAAVGAAMAWGEVSIFVHFLVVAMGLVSLLTWAAFHLVSEEKKEKNEGNVTGEASKMTIRAQRLAVLPLALLAFGGMASEGTLTNWTAIFCSHAFQSTASQSAFAYAVFAAAMTVGRLSGGALLQRFDSFKLLVISLLAAFLGLYIFIMSPNIAVAMLGLAITGLGFSNIVPLVYSQAGNTEGITTSVGVATISMVGYASFFIMPPVVGFLSDALGLRVAVGILLGIVGLMFGLVFFSSATFKSRK